MIKASNSLKVYLKKGGIGITKPFGQQMGAELVFSITSALLLSTAVKFSKFADVPFRLGT